MSLVQRITLSMVVLMALTCGAVVATLYHGLQRALILRDEQTLSNRAEQIDQLLRDGAPAQTLPRYFDRMMDTAQDILVIQPARGEAIVMNRTGVVLPESFSRRAFDAGKINHLTDRDGVDISLLRIASRAGEMPVLLTVARVARTRGEMLASYHRLSLVVCAGAIVLCLVISPLLIRRGLRAIRVLSRMTETISSAQLGQPLAAERLPEELLPLAAALNRMRARLAEDFTRLTQFCDDLAHEMRTPVSVLLGQNQVMLSKPRTVADYQRLIEDNIEELEGLTRLTDSLLFLARAEHRNVGLERQTFAPGELLADICAFLAPLAEEKQLALRVQAGGQLNADKLLFQRAVINLLTNGIRHAPAGSAVHITALARPGSLTIEVANPGPPLARPDRLFQRFWRGEDARHTPGSGLGLALVSAIAALHGGEAGYRHQRGSNIFFIRFSQP
ncbi:heavy metal sensor histidine kinase [Shimwellia blattae]|uniref:Sensor protein n=1 Tax=Shimwellia blattae (strain ATCC 29907 / DSM 4481 / JCM 1650 / NBRC 105725 / CDC 9005-74) TaxID=630626 RepID=I2B7B5_SHIBC|nr:heavy metal sensor histidine kinase [Shimwellia blattae]AFJ46419.1 heavy metal sensor histidine kinase YedV [Shimwellia blattae DSM 4481 = NBRC 105725]GAB80000.1 putative two-component histidine kinase YedV [Shimwellia blattae DSM 4481 = NBRC 105725]VDY63886.1 Probable sensor-like histidine kinase YedV [Shimwellia blattae]VEC22023.1 Probable sensor-like histidine kinase YedV [Shimwellia blattae]